MRWGMVIDVGRCVGCQTCTIACKQEHALPPGIAWRFVADCEIGEYPDVRRVFLPMQCMQCQDPACVPVCPTGASRQREDGIVWVQYDACVGCGYCAMACPYHARHLVHRASTYFDAPTAVDDVSARPGRHGVMTKCTFCKDRIDAGRARGLIPGVDADATPMCAVACIAGAIVFGDLDDPWSPVSRMVATGRARPLMPECGTRPSVHYVTGEPAPAEAPAPPPPPMEHGADGVTLPSREGILARLHAEHRAYLWSC
ncbi:MAG: 4Fe-4S dicluster domain-containing protein [Candidatus Rokubacteria bacterium]|nr:4Fe-4S dicluster domain-containing protein [Candidatus Rokubacteria bacterium]